VTRPRHGAPADLHPDVARPQRRPPLISQRLVPRPRTSHDGPAYDGAAREAATADTTNTRIGVAQLFVVPPARDEPALSSRLDDVLDLGLSGR
jgi:hypothetical protein